MRKGEKAIPSGPNRQKGCCGTSRKNVFYDGYGRNAPQRVQVLRGRRPVGAPMLTTLTAKKRPERACKRTLGLAWSDDPRLLLHLVDGPGSPLPGKYLVPGCTVGRRPAGGGSVVVLDPEPGHPCGRQFDAYLNIVADQLHPLSWQPYVPDGSGLFQQVNAALLGLRNVTGEFRLLPCPPNSRDLNPWDVLEPQVRSTAASPCCSQDLKDPLLIIWLVGVCP